MLKPFNFPKKDRILKRREFLEFYSLGKAIHSQGFILVYKSGQRGHSRIGITVSRKVGHAAVRNRIKRRIREYYRLHRLAMCHPWDIHVIARKPAATLSFDQTAAMLLDLFVKFAKNVGGATGSLAALRNHHI